MTSASPREPSASARAPAQDAVGIASWWIAWLLLLNLVWEVAQLPLYSFAPDVPATSIAFYVVHCTVGDGLIAAGTYVIAALATRDAAWPVNAPARGALIACMTAVSYTAWSEWRNVYVLASWAYAPAMPTLAGIGLSPLAQWALLPPVATWLARRRKNLFRHPR